MPDPAPQHPQPAHPIHESEYAEKIDESFDSTVAHDSHEKPHTVSIWLLISVLIGLLILTAINYSLTSVNMGQANIWITLGIAVVKAALVGAFFMHLLWDAPFNALVVFVALIFICVFIGIALLDTHEYQPNTVPQNTNAVSSLQS